MRYSVTSKVMPISEVLRKCSAVGAQSIKEMRLVKQVYCDLGPDAAKRLSQTPGLKVSTVTKVRPSRVVTAPTLKTAQVGLNLFNTYNDMRQLYSPPLVGSGLTVAVLDSGVRDTHEALVNKVVYEKNFSEAPTVADIFGHGTGVAYIIAGEANGRSGVAPGAKIMSMKVLNNNGEGTSEMLVDAIEEVCELVEVARSQGLHMTDVMYPNTMNISIGTEDDGDPDNSMRVACRVAVEEYGIQAIAAAGNSGPDLSTILVPAVDPFVIAVGGLKTWEFLIWEASSRGPTLEGFIKPDLVCWAEEIEVASHKADDEYEAKSGTSFSTPILVGADGLIWDLTRRVYGPDVRITYYDWLPYSYAYCIKPEEAPIDKDNSYGYGIPAMGSMVNQILRPVSPISTIESIIPMLVIVGIMPMITGMGT